MHRRERDGLRHVRGDIERDEGRRSREIGFSVNKMHCDTYEKTSNEMTGMLFKGDCAQITVDVNKMQCDTREEISDEMKSMLFKLD